MTTRVENSRSGAPVSTALAALYGQFGGAVYNFFRRRGCGREDALDLKQEVFLQASRAFGGFRRESKAETWIFGITKNVWCNYCRDRNRGKRRAVVVSLEPAAPDGERPREIRAKGESPFEAAQRSQEFSLVSQELAKMPMAMRECVLLHSQGRTYREIAKILQMAEGTAKSHVSRATTRLKEALSDRQQSRISRERPS